MPVRHSRTLKCNARRECKVQSVTCEASPEVDSPLGVLLSIFCSLSPYLVTLCTLYLSTLCSIQMVPLRPSALYFILHTLYCSGGPSSTFSFILHTAHFILSRWPLFDFKLYTLYFILHTLYCSGGPSSTSSCIRLRLGLRRIRPPLSSTALPRTTPSSPSCQACIKHKV